MAYSPTELNNPPNADPNYDAAMEPTKENSNEYAPAVEQAKAQAAQAESGIASTYNTGQRVF